ncbi:MAG: hypothetical protein IJA71_00465 [Clostridia bacterium]|nr:hypothetical protein [Clostridia bacterium]
MEASEPFLERKGSTKRTLKRGRLLKTFPFIILELFFFRRFFFCYVQTIVENGATACFLLGLPVLRLAASATGSARLRAPRKEKAAKEKFTLPSASGSSR